MAVALESSGANESEFKYFYLLHQNLSLIIGGGGGDEAIQTPYATAMT
jgi:hypothetical protein